MSEIEDSGHFKMRLEDEVEEAAIPTAVDELRLEKISTRVTIISIMIPVLIVIVLVITYLDIKKRVVESEDTGSMSFQNLSNDLESRFSSLSLRQARLEEQLMSFIDRSEKALASIEIKIKTQDDTTQTLSGNLASKKALNSSVADLEQKLNNIAKGLEDAQSQMNAAAEQWRIASEQSRSDLDALRKSLAAIPPQLSGISEKLEILEKNKMDKPSMELAISLEGLRIKQDLKSSIDQLSDKVDMLDKQVRVLKNQLLAPPPSPSPSKPQGTAPQPPAVTGSGTVIKEQPIIK